MPKMKSAEEEKKHSNDWEIGLLPRKLHITIDDDEMRIFRWSSQNFLCIFQKFNRSLLRHSFA